MSWLLDCHGSHGQKESFLRCFLKSLKTFPRQNKKASLLSPDQIRAPYRVTTEKKYDEGSLVDQTPSSRVDIVIENDSFLLFIEVKIQADETGSQLEKYKQILLSRAGDRSYTLAFLTLTGKPSRYTEDIACLSWNHLANEFADFVNAIPSPFDETVSTPQPLWALVVKQFCWHISQL